MVGVKDDEEEEEVESGGWSRVSVGCSIGLFFRIFLVIDLGWG